MSHLQPLHPQHHYCLQQHVTPVISYDYLCPVRVDLAFIFGRFFISGVGYGQKMAKSCTAGTNHHIWYVV